MLKVINSDKIIPIEIVDDKSLQGPIFHPGNPNGSDWRAGNVAASNYQGIRTVWKNMISYFNKSANEQGYERKLQIKSGVCELKTLIDIIPQMHSTIANTPVDNKKWLKSKISISQQELDEEGKLYKKVNIEKSKAIQRIQKIRNNIGSHFSDAQISYEQTPIKKDKRSSREKISWSEVINLWQSLELNDFLELIQTIQKYLDYINKMPIYEWYRYEPNGSIRTHCPRIGTVDETGKESICVMSVALLNAIREDQNTNS